MMSRVTDFGGSPLKFSSAAEPPPIRSTGTKDAAGKERRLHRRYVCYGFAEGIVLHPKSLFRGTIRDLSETGCFVETRGRLRVERLAWIELRFRINGNHYRTSARVMNIRPGKGLGLEFSFTDKESKEWFRALNSVAVNA